MTFPSDQTPKVTPLTGPAGSSGMCTLSYQNRVFRFRTNPNEIWWSYDLLSNSEETFGGRVTQILGTKLGDLEVRVDVGNGGWQYLMEIVLYLRDLLSDQRNGNPATFEYTTRNWKLNVYSMSIPFQDSFDATVREIPLHFKIQEDVNNILSQVTLDAALSALQDGTYGLGTTLHNKYNDPIAGAGTGVGPTPLAPGGPSYLSSGIINTVNSNPAGSNPGGLSPLASIPFASSIPGVSTVTGLLGGL